jgi:hypothetical protein
MVSPPETTIFAVFLVASFQLSWTKRFLSCVFLAGKRRGKKKGGRICVSAKMTGQLAKSARDFQRKAVKDRETVAAAARKAGVSAKVFRGALKNPGKKLRKQQEATKIKAATPKASAASIHRKKSVKIHHIRAVQRLRAPARVKLLAERRACKERNFVPQEDVGLVGRRAMRIAASDAKWFSSEKQSQE